MRVSPFALRLGRFSPSPPGAVPAENNPP